MSSSRLNPRQKLFVEALQSTKNFNATQAAREAGYKSPDKAGPQLMNHPLVKAALGKGIRKRNKRFKTSADRVRLELARIAFSDPRKMFKKGMLIPIEEMDEDIARAIASFDVESFTSEDGTTKTMVKVRLWQKTGALELLAKHMGMLNDKLQIETTDKTLETLIPMMLAKLQQASNHSNVVDQKFIESRVEPQDPMVIDEEPK